MTKLVVAALAVLGLAVFSCGPQGQEAICDNGIDDDKNGAVDCLDPACASTTVCQNFDGGNEVFDACSTQQNCLDAGWGLDRPLRVCKGSRCEAQGAAVAVRFEADTTAFSGLPQQFRTMSTRFISRVGLDNSTITCANVQAAAPGKFGADADQLEKSGKFNYLAYDVIRVESIPPGQRVPNPLLFTSTGANFIIWNELWSGFPDSNTKLPTGTRLGWGCFDSGANVNPITTQDSCLAGATACRTMVVTMPGSN